MVDSDKMLFLFSQVMSELRDIKKEIKEMNRCLAVTVERQTISLQKIEELKDDVNLVKKKQAECPARLSHTSKKQLIKDYSSIAALCISLYAIYQIFVN